MKRLLFTLAFTTFCSIAAFGRDELIELKDIAGKPHAPMAMGERKAVVLLFVSPYCPTSNAFIPEINRIAAGYGGDRFAFYLVEADADIKLDDAKKHAETMEIKAPLLIDPEHKLTRMAKATTTPEAVVISKGGQRLYQGRINDLYVSQTKKLKEPKTHDLRAALDAIAADQPVPVSTTKAIGCSIAVN